MRFSTTCKTGCSRAGVVLLCSLGSLLQHGGRMKLLCGLCLLDHAVTMSSQSLNAEYQRMPSTLLSSQLKVEQVCMLLVDNQLISAQS
jgi:hypothetical protein